MKRLLLVLVLLCASPGWLRASTPEQDNPWNPWFELPYIGLITDDTPPRYLVTAELGVEQWENSKRSERIHQLWYLQCQYPPYLAPPYQTHCSLERTMIVRWNMPGVKTGIYVHKHNTDDGTLQLRAADWERGKLEFTIVYNDQTTTEVIMRMRYADRSIFLESFRAAGIAKSWFSDEMSPIEYRIPEYGYTLQIPIEMRGYKPESRKQFDDLIASLDLRDREIWARIKDDADLLAFPSDQELRQALPKYGEIQKSGREPTRDEWKVITDVIVRGARRKLGAAGMSAAAQEKLLKFVTDVFLAEQLQR
jgi:hypothetical protein